MSEISQPVRELARLLKDGDGIVFFGGAGVSTESGIPDFRSESGLYAAKTKYGRSPEELLSHTFFVQNPDEFFRYYKESLVYRDASPNKAHYALARLESMGKLDAVVTQNIDGLHQAAGSKTVFELHGSNERQYCGKCGAKYNLDYIYSEKSGGGVTPKCEKCGGIVRPDVVLYEEGLDDDTVRGAIDAISRAKTLIVGGTSLSVYPAAGLLRYFRGQVLILINKTQTAHDADATLVIREPIGEALDAALRVFDDTNSNN
jgi:NAD-dependent deacetylase